MTSLSIEQKNYAKEFEKRLAAFVNHPLNLYKPSNFRWLGSGGQSKVLSFYSETRKSDLVVKIYPAVFYSDAKNEFNNMNLLVHENILQVFEMHTLYIGDQKKEKGAKGGDKGNEEKKEAGGSDDSSGSLNLDSDSDGSDDDQDDMDDELGEGGQHADVIIIMEKADMKLQKIINKRKKNNQPFTKTELFNFWKKLISVFAYCTMFKITHNDIKPSNILLQKKQNPEESKDDELNS